VQPTYSLSSDLKEEVLFETEKIIDNSFITPIKKKNKVELPIR
jgi:hypothetical protein